MEIVIKILIDTIVIGLISLIFFKRERKIENKIEEEFRKRDKFFDARFDFKLRALEELLAPIRLQLIRSKITLNGYDANSMMDGCNYRDSKIRNIMMHIKE